MIDMTERERARMVLPGGARLRDGPVFDSADRFMLVLDPAGTILRINRKALDLLRYDHEKELVGP